MKILLIDPPGWQKGGVNLGLGYLASSLCQVKHEVKIIDLNNNFCCDPIDDIVKSFTPDIIGYSVKTATANSTASISNRIKERFPKVLQIAGGPHISICYEKFLKANRQIKFAFIGEGEHSLVNFLELWSKGVSIQKVKGIAFYQNDNLTVNKREINSTLDKLPFPRLDLIEDINFSQFPYPLVTSRGCPYDCVFCCVGIISSKKWRYRSPQNVVSELEEAKKRYRIKRFEILDDNFTLNLNRAKEICRILIKKKIGLSWQCHNGIRADKIDEELAYLMKKAGCVSIALGIETGDEDIFRNIGKGETLQDIKRAAKLIKNAGMELIGYFIIGLPGDNLRTIKKTIEFQKTLALDWFVYGIMVPYPGTKMWDYVRKEGKILLDITDVSHFSDELKIPFETPGFTASERKQAYELTKNLEKFYRPKIKQLIINYIRNEPLDSTAVEERQKNQEKSNRFYINAVVQAGIRSGLVVVAWSILAFILLAVQFRKISNFCFRRSNK